MAGTQTKKPPVEAAEPDRCGYVPIFGQGTVHWIAPWLVTRITEGSTPGAGTIKSKDPPDGIGYDNYESGEQVAQIIWDGMKRAASTALMAQMGKNAMRDVVNALAAPLGKEIDVKTAAAVDEKLQAVLKTEILAVLKTLSEEGT